jgi:hypothetical protein
LHAVLGESSGLVGTDDRRRSERLDRREPLDEGAAPRKRGNADSERERDRGQQTFRNVRDDQADREYERVAEG